MCLSPSVGTDHTRCPGFHLYPHPHLLSPIPLPSRALEPTPPLLPTIQNHRRPQLSSLQPFPANPLLSTSPVCALAGSEHLSPCRPPVVMPLGPNSCFSHDLFAHDPANPHFQLQVWGLYLNPEAPPPHLPLPLHPASVSLYLQDSTNSVDHKYLGRIVSIRKGTIFLSINFPKLHCIY